MIDLKELKTITKAAEMVTCIIDRRGDRAVFMKTITPDIVIELLDRLEAAEKVCDAVQDRNIDCVYSLIDDGTCYNGDLERKHRITKDCHLYPVCKALKQWQEVKR